MHGSHQLRVAGHNSSSKFNGIGVWKFSVLHQCLCTTTLLPWREHCWGLRRQLLATSLFCQLINVFLSQEIMLPSLSFLIISQEEDEDQTVVPSTAPATGTFQFAPATQTLPAGGFSF